MKPVVNGHKGITFNSGNISERNQQAAFRLYIGDCSLILLLLSYSLSLLNTFTSTFITGSFISVVCSFSEPELCFGYQWLNYAECAWKRPTFTQETLVELDPYVAKKKKIYIYIYIYIYWNGLPLPSPGDLPDPGIQPASTASLALAGGFFTTEPPGKPPPWF